MSWLVPFGSLTPGQQDAVQMDMRTHKAIIGGPGAGKTLVLVHRLALLYQRTGKDPDAVHFFVYTGTLKSFIRAGIDVLGVPEDCISTLDGWCQSTYRRYIKGKLPSKKQGSRWTPDFEAIRQGVLDALDSGKIPSQQYEAVLVDETQDLDQTALDILKRIAHHITVCMDEQQQLYDQRLSEKEILSSLGLFRQNAALLSAFRCNPMVTRLAAEFIRDKKRKGEFLNQAVNQKVDRSLPLLFVAEDFEEETEKLIEMVKLRLSYGDSIGVLFPQQRQVYGFAKVLEEAGLEVEVNRRGDPIDFNDRLPKLMTYHGAKGLTFDSVLLPRLVDKSFGGYLESRVHHLLFVGSSRAVKWAYLSGVNGKLIDAVYSLSQKETSDFLAQQIGPNAGGLFPESDFSGTLEVEPEADEFGLD